MARRKSKFFDDGGKTDQEKRSEQLDKSAKTNTTTGATQKPSMFNVSPEGAAVGIATGLAGYGLYKGVKAGVKAIKDYRAPYQDAIDARKKERRQDRTSNRQERLAMRTEITKMKSDGKSEAEIAAYRKSQKAENKKERIKRRQQRQKTFLDSKQEQLTQNLEKGGKLKKVAGALRKASKMHAAQAKTLEGMSKSDANFKASMGAIVQAAAPIVAKIGAGAAASAMNKDDKKAMHGFKASINSMPSGYNKNK